MSRNKDIKLLHDMTGLAYKECRALMKKNHWDYWRAFFDAKNLPYGSIMDFANEFSKNITMICNTLGDMCREVIECMTSVAYNLTWEKEDDNG